MRRLFAASLLVLGLAACAQAPKPGVVAADPVTAKPAPATKPPAVVATPGLTVPDRVSKAVELLGQGQPERADAELQAVLREQPGHAVARRLLEQLDVDPKVLLGEKSYAYTVKPGDSMSVLAERMLGDALLFYSLARYNGIEAPSQVRAGQVLMIPGVPQKPATAAKKPPATVATVERPAAVSRNPARASQLRGAALEQMNRGAIDRAVALLKEARQLDPNNALIQRDLDRAVRVQTAVRTRS